MQPFPHHYAVSASAGSHGNVTLSAQNVVAIASDAPAEFGGPGDQWSPESLLVAAVADCFTLGFRAIARASKLDWHALRCDVTGTLDKVDGITRFTAIAQRVELTVPEGTDEEKAKRLLEKAEKVCLITNSLIAESTLEITLTVAGQASEVS